MADCIGTPANAAQIQNVTCITHSMNNLQDFAKNGRKIIGIAANYHELLKVLKRPVPETPGIFMKPSTAYITEGQPILIPSGFSVNQEVELGVVIGQKGKFITECRAMDYVGGYCVALDMTATCQMQIARSTGASWTLGKAFDTACPVSKFIPKSRIPDTNNVELWCTVNGKDRQKGNTNDLVFSVPFLISYISKYMTLEPNDLIITGSPPNMGPVVAGDIVEGGIKGLVDFKFSVE